MKFNCGEVKLHGALPLRMPDMARENRPEMQETGDVLQATTKEAMRIGGPMVDAVWGALNSVLTDDEMSRLRWDTRTHMLKPGWYPSIPGWHADFVARDTGGNIRPDLGRDCDVRHFMVVTGHPRTEFIVDREVDVPDVSSWRSIAEHVDYRKGRDGLIVYRVKPNTLVEFDGNELHRGVAAETSCWRWFCRASLFPEDHPQADSGDWLNRKRVHTQVYLDKHRGW